MMSFSQWTFIKPCTGDISKLTHAISDESNNNTILVLLPIRAYAIIIRAGCEQHPTDSEHEDNYDDWKAKQAEAVPMNRLSGSPKVQYIIKGISNPHELWNTLQTDLHSALSHLGRQDILHQFDAGRPKEDEPLTAYFPKHSKYHTQLTHTDDEITDCNFLM
jgi:hypothetical protein